MKKTNSVLSTIILASIVLTFGQVHAEEAVTAATPASIADNSSCFRALSYMGIKALPRGEFQIKAERIKKDLVKQILAADPSMNDVRYVVIQDPFKTVREGTNPAISYRFELIVKRNKTDEADSFEFDLQARLAEVTEEAIKQSRSVVKIGSGLVKPHKKMFGNRGNALAQFDMQWDAKGLEALKNVYTDEAEFRLLIAQDVLENPEISDAFHAWMEKSAVNSQPTIEIELPIRLAE